MAKKQLRIGKKPITTDKGNGGHGVTDIGSLLESVKSTEDDNLVRMNFEVGEGLRNAFKSKVAAQGKLVKDVLATFMQSYVDDKSNI